MTSDWKHFILTLGLFYEISKGNESYWYPYIRLIVNMGSNENSRKTWTADEIEMLQDDECMH